MNAIPHLWQTYATLTDAEAVFRSLKSELGLRPIFHHKQGRADAHLFISVLAYQAVQTLRKPMKAANIHDSWTTLRQTLAPLQRTTTSFRRRDGGPKWPPLRFVVPFGIFARLNSTRYAPQC